MYLFQSGHGLPNRCLELGLLRFLPLIRLFVFQLHHRVFILSRYIHKYIWLDFGSWSSRMRGRGALAGANRAN